LTFFRFLAEDSEEFSQLPSPQLTSKTSWLDLHSRAMKNEAKKGCRRGREEREREREIDREREREHVWRE
jgi:hypothetical protein